MLVLVAGGLSPGVPLHAQEGLAFSDALDFRLPDTLYRAELDSLLVRELDAPFVAHLLNRGRDLEADSAYQVLHDAAELVSGPGEDDRALRLLAVDRLAATIATPWLPVGPSLDSLASQRRRRLEEAGIRYTYNEPGMYWAYAHDLLRELWRTAPESRWGAHGFLLLQLRGWDTSSRCEAGAAAFGPVIERGEAFLRDRASTTWAPYVALTVAQAYETLWSLALMASDDPYRDYVDPGPLQDDAEQARRRSIELYRRVARDVGDPGIRAYALAKAEALDAGVDTTQRKFVCVYD